VNGPVICGIEDASDAGVAGVARELADRFELPLLYVHVLNGGDAEEATRLLREAAARDGQLAVEQGHPADRLVELARQRDCSFLVVGNHGPRSSLLGSISADVSRRAPCPVIVVPPTAAPVARAAAADESAVEGGIVRCGLGGRVAR
jgi:nucleotide-binding universal stress UspA family protein